jgi:hypothetical protein
VVVPPTTEYVTPPTTNYYQVTPQVTTPAPVPVNTSPSR